MAVQCDLPDSMRGIPGSQQILGMLSNAAGDVCFYGCFAAVLYQAAIQKGISLNDQLARVLSATQRTVQQLLRAPGYFGEIGVDFLNQISQLLDDIASGTLSGKQWQQLNFPSAAWAFFKSYIARYAREIVLAAIQKMDDEMIDMFEKRANRCALLDQEIQKLMAELEALAGYEWWDDLARAIQEARQRLGQSFNELQRVQVGVATGSFDRRQGEAADGHLLVAYSRLSDVDDLGNLIESLGKSALDGLSGDPFTFSYSGPEPKAILRDALKHLRMVGEHVKDIQDHWGCLMRISHRIDVLKSNIQSAAQVVDSLNRNGVQMGVSVDVLFGDATVNSIMEGILRVMTEMEGVVERVDRVGAPAYVASWRGQIAVWIQSLNTLNILPNLPFASGLGLEGMTEDNEAVNELKYMLYPHDPTDGYQSLSEMDVSLGSLMGLMERFIRSTGDFGRLLGDRDSWRQHVDQVRSGLREVVGRDRNAKRMCEHYSGNESDVFDWIYGAINGMGWRSALELLSRGMVIDLLSLSISEAVQDLSTLMSCLEGLQMSYSGSAGVKAKLEKLSQEQQAQTLLALRSSATLPAYQFRVLNLINDKLQEVEQDLAQINDMASVACG